MRRILCLCACLCLTSCGGAAYDHKTYLTSGQVLVNGQPAEKVEVGFHPQGDMDGKPFFPVAVTDGEGKFFMTTYIADDGAPVGDYQVELTWPTYIRKTGNGPDRLGGKFAKGATSGLKAHVDAVNINVIQPFDLKVDPAVIKAAEAATDKNRSKTGAKKKQR
jgi:hypothetical protein